MGSESGKVRTNEGVERQKTRSPTFPTDSNDFNAPNEDETASDASSTTLAAADGDMGEENGEEEDTKSEETSSTLG